jgi:lysozyme family protein
VKDNFERCLKFVLHHEGGWADHPRDPGGATMKGVTLAVYKEYLGREASKEELRLIPDAHLHDLYRTRYWDKARCDEWAAGLDLSVFDLAVNGGTGRAAKILQRCVGAEPDGAIGPKTIAAVNAIPAENLIVRFAEGRREFYKGLKTFDTFGRGWLRRTDECEIEAIKMAGEKL